MELERRACDDVDHCVPTQQIRGFLRWCGRAHPLTRHHRAPAHGGGGRIGSRLRSDHRYVPCFPSGPSPFSAFRLSTL